MPPAGISASTDYLGYGYAALLIVGGLMGGIKKGSVVSAVAGVGSGVAAAYGASRVSQNTLDVWPAMYVAIALLALMTWRFSLTGKFMPAGLVMTLSLLMTIRYSLMIV
ncbi:hypothetical protein IAT38_006293 [Cryptococcus sp. DSM 104549]